VAAPLQLQYTFQTRDPGRKMLICYGYSSLGAFEVERAESGQPLSPNKEKYWPWFPQKVEKHFTSPRKTVSCRKGIIEECTRSKSFRFGI
jgi:hypothetical protein